MKIKIRFWSYKDNKDIDTVVKRRELNIELEKLEDYIDELKIEAQKISSVLDCKIQMEVRIEIDI